MLKAVKPAGIQAALNAWQEGSRQEDEKRKALRLVLEKASYETQRVRRQYDAVDPENRLVASELESYPNTSIPDSRCLVFPLSPLAPEHPSPPPLSTVYSTGRLPNVSDGCLLLACLGLIPTGGGMVTGAATMCSLMRQTTLRMGLCLLR